MGNWGYPPRIEVMHGVPERADRRGVVQRLCEQASACVHLDETHRGPLYTLLACLVCARDSSSEQPWVVVCQDDAEPLPGWRGHLIRACEHSPEPVLGLSNHGAQRYHAAFDPDRPYLVGRYVLSGGAFAVRRDILDDLVAWSLPLWEEDRFFHDDVVLAAFAEWVGARTACTAFSIFDQNLRSSLRRSAHWLRPGHPDHLITVDRRIDWEGGGVMEFVDEMIPARSTLQQDRELCRLLDLRYDRQARIVPTRIERGWAKLP